MGRLGEKEQIFCRDFGPYHKKLQRAAEVHFEAGYVPMTKSLMNSATLRAIGEPLSGKNVNDISMANVLTQLFEVTEQFNMETRPELLLLQKTGSYRGCCKGSGSQAKYGILEPIVKMDGR